MQKQRIINSKTRSISNFRISSKTISRILIQATSPRSVEYTCASYIESYISEAFMLLRIAKRNHMLKFLLILFKRKISIFGLIVILTNY
jgi:hypothetical protein